MVTHTPTRALVALAVLVALPACSSGEPGGDAGEEEFITQVNVMLTPTGGGAAQMFTLNYDEEGVLTGTTGQVTLTPGLTYGGEVELLDTINNEDITREIEGEAEEHLFRYTLAPSSAGTVTITDREEDYDAEDSDGDGDPDDNNGNFAVGLQFELAVSPTATGTATMTGLLYHFNDGPKTSSTATSDEIDVEFEVPLQF